MLLKIKNILFGVKKELADEDLKVEKK